MLGVVCAVVLGNAVPSPGRVILDDALLVAQASSEEAELEADMEKAREKLRWMGERVRHPRGREIARAYMERSLSEFDRMTA